MRCPYPGCETVIFLPFSSSRLQKANGVRETLPVRCSQHNRCYYCKKLTRDFHRLCKPCALLRRARKTKVPLTKKQERQAAALRAKDPPPILSQRQMIVLARRFGLTRDPFTLISKLLTDVEMVVLAEAVRVKYDHAQPAFMCRRDKIRCNRSSQPPPFTRGWNIMRLCRENSDFAIFKWFCENGYVINSEGATENMAYILKQVTLRGKEVGVVCLQEDYDFLRKFYIKEIGKGAPELLLKLAFHFLDLEFLKLCYHAWQKSGYPCPFFWDAPVDYKRLDQNEEIMAWMTTARFFGQPMTSTTKHIENFLELHYDNLLRVFLVDQDHVVVKNAVQKEIVRLIKSASNSKSESRNRNWEEVRRLYQLYRPQDLPTAMQCVNDGIPEIVTFDKNHPLRVIGRELGHTIPSEQIKKMIKAGHCYTLRCIHDAGVEFPRDIDFIGSALVNNTINIITCLNILHDNGLPLTEDNLLLMAKQGQISCLLWARTKGAVFTARMHLMAITYKQKETRKWLEERGCPLSSLPQDSNL